MMKTTFIRTDRKNKRHLRLWLLSETVEAVKDGNFEEDITPVRDKSYQNSISCLVSSI